MTDLLLLCLAGTAAGLLNAVAGGGTFLSLPALFYVGLPPVAANATATLSALPGYLSSAWSFRGDMRAEGTLGFAAILSLAALGSILGAFLLIVTPGETFLWIVPWLLLLATLLFATGPMLLKILRRSGTSVAGPVLSGIAILAVSVYGGCFNGGLGIMLLATFGLLGHVDLHGMNGLKNVLSALLSLVSAAAFVWAGLIVWEQAAVMAASAMAGGYAGARLSRRIVRTDLLRGFITLVGASMTVAFFVM
ncbi:TSUP family transporter [Alphaproteobacteria bacterium GH1-50]|uniref:Probable membrane transporter protein n=1 Tax=Kangsaoukella pontilimi TaxID=2691042 RepID=A0A7C9IJK4_9RHOB|nr:sulfite exporter TauE/SafE family protein [Kangsaoukella pontilimi]MXQ08942.1 TSUP family transporter [Kangsaoukella pontilimi]